MLSIGVDTGGTFTDFIWHDGQQWQRHKRLSTPDNPARAVLEGLQHVLRQASRAGPRMSADPAGQTGTGDGGQVPGAARSFVQDQTEACSDSQLPMDVDFHLVHGSTVATNAILEGRGARTALITNRGFEDVIEIARQNRPLLYALCQRRNPPLVPRALRFGVSGRIDSAGRIIEPLDAAAIPALGQALAEAGVESIAVCLLFSFANPEHECRVRDGLGALGIPVSLSHEILAEFREYERSSTTVINAYVAPKMRAYLEWLESRLHGRPLRIMQSNGGSISAATAMQESVRTILSGPAGGVVGALEIGRAAGHERLISFDMGGTSTDVALLDGHLPLSMESDIAGHPVKLPMIAIHTVGAGGGSIARRDAGGALCVGPESAGADPGPICYGRGEAITVTDAHLYLGRLIPEHFLGGDMCLDRSRLQTAFERLASELGIEATALAEGILRVANVTMERAIRVISVERGFDPREFTLLSFGGAGGLHAAELARELDMPRVLVPRDPGILSAAGMLMADIIKDYSQTVMLGGDPLHAPALEAHFTPLERRAREQMRDEGMPEANIELQRHLDMRYRGQSFEILVPWSGDFREHFHQLHERQYGHCDRGRPVEVVNARLRAIGRPERPPFPRLARGGPEPAAAALLGERTVIFDGMARTTSLLDRRHLAPGNRFRGPAIVVEYSSTLVVPPFASARVDDFGNILLDIHADGF